MPSRKRAPAKRKSTTRNKTLHYKRARFVGTAHDLSLATLLQAALKASHYPMRRLERLGESNDNIRVVNGCKQVGSLTAGQFLDYTEGGAQAVLKLDPKATELAIEELSPSKAKQFLEGVLTFGVRENHVILIQAKGLRAGHLENHLNWLLHEMNACEPGVRLYLEDEPRRDIRDKLDVRWIELHAPVSVASFLGSEPVPKGIIGQIIEALRDSVSLEGSFYESLSTSQVLDLQDVDLSVRIARKGRGRQTDGPSIVDELAHTLRNIDDFAFVLRTKAGATITNYDLKLSEVRPVPTSEGGQVDIEGAAAIMQAWLTRLLVDRHIEGD
jgi:hypothetical protein